MKFRSLYLLLLLALMAFAMPACNDDIFIEQLVLSADSGVLGPDNKTVTIDISGGNWTISDIWYSDDEGSTRQLCDDGVCRISTAFSELSMTVNRAGLVVSLESYIGSQPGILNFMVENGYDYHNVIIEVQPTDTYEIKIEDVSYDLDRWSGYPDEDFTSRMIAVSYPEGLPEAISYQFPSSESLPMLYKFEPKADAGIFAHRVLNCGKAVPIPSYGPFAGDESHFWVMADQSAKLTASRSQLRTTYLPPMPPAVELPAGKPLALGLMCEYESIGLYCTVKALNPATGQTEAIECELRLIMPKKLRTTLVYL